ncbi:hypothetical protein [Formosa haliotis]|uniref:hypothetical protein n=1 Tax=Formosa haliotis TaxID=1555194 RepID=UPI000826DF2C|nr:hypothetical protein [Formosa haliotis]
MKKATLICLLLGLLLACSNDDDSNTNTTEVIGTWKLTEMTGNLPNSTTSGDEMEWQETYLFNPDLTFTKSRERNGITTEASGTFLLKQTSHESLLELKFNTENDIIGSCYSDLKEDFYIEASNTLSSTWKNCDGPGLIYKKQL